MSRSIAFAICLVAVAAFSMAVLADAVVTFPDPGLQAAIREAIAKPTGDILESDLVGLTYFQAGDQSISDLTGIEHCVDLEFLYLFNNRIVDLAPLAGLTDLWFVQLGFNRLIHDLTPLAGLTQLTGLGLDLNQISDLGPLAGLTALTMLGLNKNHISDLAPLAGLTQLMYLWLEDNQISDIGPLVLNAGIGVGDTCSVLHNYLCLDYPSAQDWADVNALLSRGTSVRYDPQTDCVCDSAAVFRVTKTGIVQADSDFYGSSFKTGAADVAEWVQVTGLVGAGDVLELDPSLGQAYRLAQTPCSDLIAGVVSTQPGVMLGGGTLGPQQALLALSGIVPVKVTNEGGPIQPGDLLVSSSMPGYAMRWAGSEPCPCALVGKALQPMTDDSGTILVLLTAH